MGNGRMKDLDKEIMYVITLYEDKMTSELYDKVLDIKNLAKKRVDSGDFMPRVVEEGIRQLEELIDCEVKHK